MTFCTLGALRNAVRSYLFVGNVGTDFFVEYYRIVVKKYMDIRSWNH